MDPSVSNHSPSSESKSLVALEIWNSNLANRNLLMCGIAGVVASEKIDENIMASMTHALNHRGPDAHGLYIADNGAVALGHRRLSIIDLTAAADQPMHTPDGRFSIVFNGEIYNFKSLRETLIEKHGIKFRTSSDTEVILYAFQVWGPEMVDQLQGMFAIALYDQREHKLFLFRDRVGKKPLFYYAAKGFFAFASEIKALLRHPIVRNSIKVNDDVIPTFLHLGYIPEPSTIYTQIHKFPAGHYGDVNSDGDLVTKRYWAIEKFVNLFPITSVQQATATLSALLNASVKQRLISDVPIGSFLSGGTDSSLVSAVASRQLATPLKTFSIGFKESRFDERKYAAEISTALGTSHTEYVLEEKEAIDILETYLKHFDEPFADTSAIPTMLVSKLARKEVTVALTGDGGDELFQGYGAYEWARRLDTPTWKISKPVIRKILEASASSKWLRISKLLAPVDKTSMRSHIFSQEQYFFTQNEIHNELLLEPQRFTYFHYQTPEAFSALPASEQQALFDLQYYLKDDLLVKVDRASMFWGLECRSPLLDHRIIEFAFSLDSTLKQNKGTSKWLLKNLLRDYLPDRLVDRPKWGFSVPLATWLSKDLRYLADDFLNDKVIDEIGLFKKSAIQKLLANFERGQNYLYHRIWVLIVLHKWLIECRKQMQ